jgi:DNA-directed RNA polymerase III subunit RPC1
MKIIHERYKGKQAEDDMEVLLSDLGNAMQINPDVGGPAIRSNLVEDLTPTRVLELFQAIPDYDCDLLWMDVLAGGRPESLILTNLLVPPVPIRPSVAMEGGAGSNEDDLTIKLQEILDVNIMDGLSCCHVEGLSRWAWDPMGVTGKHRYS